MTHQESQELKTYLEERFDEIDKRFDGVEQRFDGVEQSSQQVQGLDCTLLDDLTI